MIDDKTREHFQTRFETLSIDDATTRVPSGATIVPGDRVQEQKIKTLDSLPRLRFDEGSPPETHPDLRVIGTLGEGGMGIVRLATQVPLRREVAVKTLRRMDDEARTSLLLEAHVTGHLEHPNIVPIYTLGQDAQGAPVIVMKRIEGTSWLEFLRSRNDCREELDRHLEILLQVTNALRFAHARGIVHRDIKPENVMIGNFGEVYLLDWGIAITLEDDVHLPRRDEARGIAGTPAYMAPEMTRDDAAEVDFRTDVYLAGATLHEVLVGQPRHQGDSLFEMMFSAFRSDPYDYPDDVPEELAAIANRACSAAAEDRHQTIDEFREALQEYVDHRESLELTRETDERLEHLVTAASEGADEAAVHDLFGECRFGFEQALRMWPENERAARGRRTTLEEMIHFYIEADNFNAARSLFTELREPSLELREKLAELDSRLGKREERFEELQEFARDNDLRTAATSRSIVAIVLGVFWALMAMRSALWGPSDSIPNVEHLEIHFEAILRNISVAAVVLVLFRKRVFRNVANRRLMYLLITLLSVMFVLRLLMFIDGQVNIVTVRTAEMTLYVYGVIMVGVISDPKIALLSVYYLAAAFGGVYYPEYQLYLVSAANLLTFLGFAWFWRPSRMDRKSHSP